MNRVWRVVAVVVVGASLTGDNGASSAPTGKTNVYLRNWLLAGPLPRFAPEDKIRDLKPGEFCWGFTQDFLKADGGKTVTGLKTHQGDDLMVRIIYPNPKFPRRYVAMHYAADPKQLANFRWERWQSPDYLILRPNRDPKKDDRYEVLEAGVFDTHWRLQPASPTTTAGTKAK